jgi:hypothetical protein
MAPSAQLQNTVSNFTVRKFFHVAFSESIGLALNMDIGDELRDAAEEILGDAGGNVLVHKNWGTAQARRQTVRGLKSKEKSPPFAVYFQFLQRLEVNKGDLLQQEGSATLWRVIDVDENMQGKTFVSLNARVSLFDATEHPPESLL